ncbi:MAG: HAMP domain-containing sensor histidine kinase [Streptosporangiaceae bacterium]|jgi:signal transduction histidine kinase
MLSLGYPGSVLGFRRPGLRARMTLLYGAVICASGVALLGVMQLLAPSLFGHDVHQAGEPGQPGVGMAGQSTRVPLPVGSATFWNDVVVLVILAVSSLAVGWLIAGRFVRPLRSIIATAHDISASNLHRRLGVRGPGDEFTELGQTLDDLFGRLDASFQAQRHFIANASHELRTPLTAGRALLQVALADPEPTVETLRATCEELVELGDQQERLISALLALASSQRGIGQPECLDLADIAGDALLARQEEAERRGIHLRAALDAAPVTTDVNLTESLIANLLDNAIRHNMPGGQAEISTALTTAGAVIAVSNTGVPIPPDAVQDLFQPFRQLGTERTRRGEGHGLGLAIVRAIADAHGAALTARARPAGGLDIEVTFPLTPADQRANTQNATAQLTKVPHFKYTDLVA